MKITIPAVSASFMDLSPQRLAEDDFQLLS
jgi:hypothetical protein